MPTRTSPTARQERLGSELRRLRDQAGMTAREAAALLDVNPIQMSQIESGRSGLSEVRLRRLAGFYGCGDPALIDALVKMAVERHRGWWEDFRGILPPAFHDLAEFEHWATYLRSLEIPHVPGLLQTEDYARAVFSYVRPELSPEDVDARVAHRVGRRVVLDKDDPPEFAPVIHEAALRIMVGTRKTAHAQLLHLLDLSEHPGVTVRIIPFSLEGFGGAGNSMYYVGSPVAKLDTVLMNGASGSAVNTEPQLWKYRSILDKAQESALGPAQSRDMIHRIAEEL